jgi:hypothetical protein
MKKHLKTVQDLFNAAGLSVIARYVTGDEDYDDEIFLDGKWQGSGDVGYTIQLNGRNFGANFYDGEGDDFGFTCLGNCISPTSAVNAIIQHITKNNTLGS